MIGKRTPTTLMVAALVCLGLTSTASAETPPATGSCVAYDDDPGIGGSDASCGLSCGAYAELVIAGFATDPNAKVTGAYNCGGTAALCAPGNAPACSGASPGTTSTSGQGSCGAESDEFWSSMVWVACATIGGVENSPDPHKVICQIYPDFPDCPKDHDKLLTSRRLCQREAESRDIYLTTLDYDYLFPAAFSGQSITSLRATAYFIDGGMVSFLAERGICQVELKTAFV